MNDSASNASKFTNLDLFENLEPNDYFYKFLYNSKMCI